ncbi:MAG: UDP-glucose--hexose-1-phosphate uridylyltransferase [Anaerolineales bacterium]|nr:UDP-glucose--hexose-1-phosphate uridylyltransferase [Anaerolineales bacterium]
MKFNAEHHPHRRFNPLTGDWVLVSPHRARRPWQGQVEKAPTETRPAYDPGCYLCPGNERAGGISNPDYSETFVFTNDFQALLPEQVEAVQPGNPLLQLEPVHGTCRVICFSPRHNLTLQEMDPPDIRTVIDLWADQTRELGREYTWVQVFQNQGAMMGASNPHPHGQIWAGSALPDVPSREETNQRAYFQKEGTSLLIAYADLEAECGERVVLQNEDWLVVVPFWAVWPFETLLLPRRPIQRLPDVRDSERSSLAAILKRLLIRYDNLFETPFPYSMGWHGAPFLQQNQDHWQLHAHFFPPLLRSASVRKFLVGYEMLAEAQRDLTPEQAARRLQDLPDTHYRQVENG